MKRDSFYQWKNKVDAIVMAKVGLGVDDLPDWDFATAYDAGVSPRVAANRCIAACKRVLLANEY